MQVGWPGSSRAIAGTIVITSAFWISLGLWLFQSHLGAGAVVNGSRPPITSIGSAEGPGKSLMPVKYGAASAHGPTPPALGAIRIPVAGVAQGQLTDTFAQARAGGARHHDAIDIPAPEGTPVIAAAPGRVEKLFLSDAGGNTIYVRSVDQRMIYYYAHLSAYAPGVQNGRPVRSGQLLGWVGYTGNASADAPHLHFAMSVTDPAQGWSQDVTAINPYPYLVGKGAATPRAGK